MQITQGRCRKFGQSISLSIPFLRDLLNAEAAKSGNQILHFLEILFHTFIPYIIFIQQWLMISCESLQAFRCHSQLHGYYKPSDQVLVLSFIVSTKELDVEGILDILLC